MAKPGSKRTPTQSPSLPPYPPSWIDRLTDWLDHRPGGAWVYYLAMAVVPLSIQIVVQRHEGNPAVLAQLPFFILVTAGIAYNVALMHHLDRRALAALAGFRDAMSVSRSEEARIGYELTTLPAGPALGASLGGVMFVLVALSTLPKPFPWRLIGVTDTSLSITVTVLIVSVLWFTTGALIYHTVHQLRTIQRIFRTHVRVDLYHLKPLYSFSDLSARTAIGINLVTYAYLFVTPQLWSSSLGSPALTMAFFLLLGPVTFAWPLWGMHRLMVKEKLGQLGVVSSEVKTLTHQLHLQLQRRSLAGIDGLHKALASLEIERAWLARIPTWPWQPETLRSVLGAILFPLVVWGLQQLLSGVALR